MDLDPASDLGTRARAGRHRRGDLVERIDRRREGRRPGLAALPRPSATALLGLLVLVLVAAGAIHLSTRGSAIPAEPSTPPSTERIAQETDGPAQAPAGDPASSAGAVSTSAPPAPVVVHVSGQVANPGVVELPAGSRVEDAISAAGGAGGEADLDAVNLARPVVDGEQIHVPAPGEEPAPQGPPPAGGSRTGEAGGAPGGPIDLNSADAPTLQQLPGVGPALAQRIIDHREANGPFQDVADLEEVSGIGPATLARIAPMATV
ncbi:helix-hairpin-helix domain-containing protein [Brachybacterium hainanense]|uniref:Helix-hairpin-helix domain-containing protein n=1 Tax=Brachybacterium hainanense TaxID=1541174 RepID=A0ABV6RBH1_9MICO